jgi:dihydrofolate reductase
MAKVFFSVSISMDGFLAGPNGGPKNPLGDNGTEIHKWIYNQKSFREQLELGAGGETGKDNDILKEVINRSGTSIMGKRMFEEGESNWPENAPFHTPVYVLTKHPREPWVRKGGTTFYFINDGIESALDKARKAAGNRDIRISGGANVIQPYLNAGLVDDFTIHYAPVMLGTGIRLFNKIDTSKFTIEIVEAVNSPLITHLLYKLNNKQDKK